MKIQNLSVIFLVIIIPIIMVVSYYIQLQIDTITLQTTYDSKLIAATKDAIEAFEINTVEWNNKYSNVAGSRRRDVEASINTFMTALSDGMGVSGINREYIENYIPAILYTLNDGYYIYTPTKSYKTLKDENGVEIVYESENTQIEIPGTKPIEGTILYELKPGYAGEGVYKYKDGSEKNFTTTPTDSNVEKIYQHTLLPFLSYSEYDNDKKYTINYTLDNYIKISGKFTYNSNHKNYGGDKTKPLSVSGGRASTPTYIKEEGHLVYFNDSESNIKETQYTGLKYNGTDIKTEFLKENIIYKKDDGTYTTEPKDFNYIYIEDSQGDKTKLYYDSTAMGNNWFTINSKDERVFLSDDITNVTQYVYKKVSLPGINISGFGSNDPNGVSMLGRYINFYLVLNRR